MLRNIASVSSVAIAAIGAAVHTLRVSRKNSGQIRQHCISAPTDQRCVAKGTPEEATSAVLGTPQQVQNRQHPVVLVTRAQLTLERGTDLRLGAGDEPR
jgi:hypothetical protein